MMMYCPRVGVWAHPRCHGGRLKEGRGGHRRRHVDPYRHSKSPARETLNDQQLNRLRQLIIKHQTLWNTQPKETPDHVRPCDFELREGAAFSAKTRPMNEPARENLRKITLEQLSKNIIEPSTSRFSSAVVLVPKNGGGVRFAIDYRALNKEIDADAYTLPNVAEALSSLHGCKQFSAVDMKEAFWSIPLAERVREYTAFQTPDGLMQYRRMPMGLKTASAVFCRHVDKMLGAMKWTKVLAYVDDLLVFGKSNFENESLLIFFLDESRRQDVTCPTASRENTSRKLASKELA